MRRVPWALVALPALGVARLLPETGGGLYVRLAAATACLLLPGLLVARALRVPGPSAALACSFGVLFAASAVVFLLHTGLWLALVLVAAAGAAALPLALRRAQRVDEALRGRTLAGVLVAGAGFGIAMWSLTPELSGGDDLFHLARVWKLDAFGDLSLASANEFKDGGLHPGYAFPLWHVFLALVGRIGGVAPDAVVLHEASVLAPLAFAVAWEAGASLFRSAAAGVGACAAQVGIAALAAGGAGAYTALALPATSSRQLFVPAVIALFFATVSRRSWEAAVATAAAALALAFIHPTYALFVALPLGGYVVARSVLARTDFAWNGVALAAVVAPAVAVALWLRPIAKQTASVDPSPEEVHRALEHYKGQLDVFSDDRYRLAPEVFGRSGTIAVAALLAVPLAGLAARRRWAALALGGSLAVLAVMLVPELFTRFSDVVSISQARRAAGFLPFALVAAGGAAVLARLLSWGAIGVALGAGIAFQLAFPGDFGYRLADGGPAIVTWIALAGGGVALLAGVFLPRRLAELDRPRLVAALSALALVAPVAVHGFAHWDRRTPLSEQLTPGLVDALRAKVPRGSVVFSDSETSYRIGSVAPLYVASDPPGHVADTKKNRPYERRDDERAFFRTGNLAIPRRYGAEWLVLNRRLHTLDLELRPVYSDTKYVLYRL